MKALIATLAALALTGCASTNYADYRGIHEAYAKAQEARYTAIGAVGASGDATAKVAAMFALMGAGNQSQANVAAPKSAGDSALAWAGILVPSLTQGYGMFSGTRLGMRQSDNATVLGVSTNETFLGMAGHIQSPAPNMTIGGSGVIGSGSYTTIDNSYNPSPVEGSYNPIDNSSQPVDNSVIYPPAVP